MFSSPRTPPRTPPPSDPATSYEEPAFATQLFSVAPNTIKRTFEYYCTCGETSSAKASQMTLYKFQMLMRDAVALNSTLTKVSLDLIWRQVSRCVVQSLLVTVTVYPVAPGLWASQAMCIFCTRSSLRCAGAVQGRRSADQSARVPMVLDRGWQEAVSCRQSPQPLPDHPSTACCGL